MAADDASFEALGGMRCGSLSRGIRLGWGLGGRLVRLFGRWEPAGFKFAACLLRRRLRSLARSVGIPIVTLAEAGKIDTDFDGADEVDSRLNLIKGYGGALVREKIVAASSRRLVVLVGYEKIVKRLGDRGSIPVEVVPFGVLAGEREDQGDGDEAARSRECGQGVHHR